MTDLNEIDRKILHELARDGRLSNVQLAERVGLSPSACLRRVQELERQDLISGYHARLNKKKLGRNFIAYLTIGLSSHERATQIRFEQAMGRAPQVVECHNITGNYEYLLRVEVADIETYKHFHSDILGAIPEVAKITSLIVLDTTKDFFFRTHIDLTIRRVRSIPAIDNVADLLIL